MNTPLYNLIRQYGKEIKAQFPELWRLCYPRRYLPPAGYASPEIHAASIMSDLAAEPFIPNHKYNKTEVDVSLIHWGLIECGVPTFFVENDYIASLAMSDPPEKMRMDELQWPFNAMVFVLPEKFQREYFGVPVPFIRVAKCLVKPQTGPAILRKFVINGVRLGDRNIGVDYGKTSLPSGAVPADSPHGYFASGEVFFGEKPLHYSSSWPLTATIGDAMSVGKVNFKDWTEQNASGWVDASMLLTPEQDIEIANKIYKVSVWMLLGMMATPEHIESESIARPAKVKRGCVVKEELWNPNIIGRRYTWNKEPQGGTHASPRFHIRRGHFTHQPHGPGRTLRKLIWLRPMAVNANVEDNT